VRAEGSSAPRAVMLRPDRSPGRPVTRFGWRLRLFATGAVLAGVGLYFDWRWPIWAAIAVLLAGMAVRFLPSQDDESGPPSEEGNTRLE
jgi:hypothetical protein